MAETGFKLRTAAPSGDWRSFVVAAPSGGCTSGQMAKIHDTVGVYKRAEDAGEDVAFIYHAEKIVVPKVDESNITFEIGDKVYFDESAAAVTCTSSGNLWIGIALEAATYDDAEVLIDLKGDKAT